MSTPTPARATNATAPPPATVSPPPSATPSGPPPPADSAPPPVATSPPPPASAPPPETPSPPPPTAPAPTPPTPSPPPPSTSSPSPPPPSTSSPPPSSTSPPPPVSSSPPPTTASPPTSSASPPPPTTSSPPATSASPPPPSTSSPPATSASPPPPSTPSPPTSSASPPPPRSSSSPPTSSSSPPPPPTNSTTPSLLSPPPPLNSGSTPARSPPPPPATSSSSSSGISAGVVVGIAIGGVAIFLLLILVFVCFRKKKRHHGEEAFHSQPPLAEYKDDPYGIPPNRWRQNAPPPPGPIVGLKANPSPPPALNAYTPSFLQPYISSSGGSGSNYSGPETPVPPPPGSVLGLSKSTFSYEELALATDGFSEANLLGQGGFGYVHRGVLPNGKEVAVKQLKAGSGQGEREFQAEVEIISRVHHRHLVSLVGYCITGSQRLLVYDYIPNNTLEFHLHGKGRPTMDWSSRMRIALGSAKGLAYLHEDCNPKIIHRDIKAANILLDFKFEAKVADFGLAKFTSDVNTHVSTRVMGTFGYLAPEYASSGKLSEKSDVFSFGVMLLELITGHRPVDTTQTFMEDSLVEWARPLLIRAVEDENFDGLVDPKLQGNFSPPEMARMVACAAACVRHSAKRRPRMSQVVRALEGDASMADLNEGVRPGHSTVYGESSDYDSSQYKEDMKKFRKMALGSRQFGGSSEYSGGTSDYGLYPSGSSSEGQTNREKELRKLRNGSQALHVKV